MKTVVLRTVVGCALLGLACGCGRRPEVRVGEAPVVYDLPARMAHAFEERRWTELDLSSAEDREYLVAGWGSPTNAPGGTRGVWARSRQATVRFFAGAPEALTLGLRCVPYTRSRAEQHLDVRVNGREVGRLHLERAEKVRDYEVAIPAEMVQPGENIITFVARYASTRHHEAVFFSRLTLEGEQGAPRPGFIPAEGGWEQQPATRVAWRIVVPEAGCLRCRPAFAGDSTSCRVFLRSGEARYALLAREQGAEDDVVVDLSRHAGRRGVLEFEVNGTSAVTWEAVVGGLVTPGQVNVLFFTIDTLRADHVGACGYGRETTPTLDRLAEEGVLFCLGYTASNESVPSHLTMLTGRYPQSHGVVANSQKIDEQQTTLAELLGRRGFRTAAFTTFPLMAMWETTGKGFEHIVLKDGVPERLDLTLFRGNIFAHACEWMKAHWRERLFVWVHNDFLHMGELHEPHRTMFWTPPRRRAPEGRYFPLMDRDGRSKVRQGFNRDKLDLDMEEIEAVKAFYDGAIRYADDYVGALLAALANYGLDPFTAVIVTSDHGVSLGARHRISHIGPPYDHLLRVPLLFVLPGSGAGAGAKPDALVETVDIAPTLLSYLGARVPRRMQGMDLMPLIRGASEKGKERVYAIVARKGSPWFSVGTKDWRYAMTLDGEEFLRPNPDNGETRSVAEQHPEARDQLRAAAMKWARETPSVVPEGEQQVSDEIREMLRKAGYLDDIQ